jgi:hypothetical protein
MNQPLNNWQDLINAPKSKFFKGHTQDTLLDRSTNAILSPSTEAIFTQSNARVLLGHAANGMLRMVALPTQVYPAPTQTDEFGLGPGMYHHFDVVMYAGDLTYQVVLGNGKIIDMGADDRENDTVYADHFIPLTTTNEGELEITTVSFAPVAPDASNAPLSPAPLPGPAGVFHILILKNTSDKEVTGKVRVAANDLLVGHYEDATPEMRVINKPAVNLRQNTLILSCPEGAVGVHLQNGKWNQLEAPFIAIRDFKIAPGEQQVFETHVALGAEYRKIMPIIYDLHRRTALDWLNLTISYWRSRLGNLTVETADSDDGEFSRDIYIRSLFDNFNCLQTDAKGDLIAHWQGAPSHGYGTVWGIDVEPTAVSVVNLCPEIARQTMVFFMTRSRVPKGPADHSVPILVAPVIIARQWLQATGDNRFLEENPDVIIELMSIMDHLKALKSPIENLFPSRYSSDGVVGRRYDYGTNVKVHYTFDSMAYILNQIGRVEEAEGYYIMARAIRQAISKNMTTVGPFGQQITGGTNLDENPSDFYLPEDVLYYDGEDTSSMLAPIYGVCDQSDPAWGNYHRYARSLWCSSYDMEFDVLLWSPTEPAIFDGTGFFSRLGGSVSLQEMEESLKVMREIAVDDVTGSVFWWPHGLEYKRSLTRCSQGQGAWAWQYLEQWLGLKVDTATTTLTLAPRGLASKFQWRGFKPGAHDFDIAWEENQKKTTARVTNNNTKPWTIQVGFRPFGTGAESPLSWQYRLLLPGEEVEFIHKATEIFSETGIDKQGMLAKEVENFGEDGLIFRRFGPAQLWGHWDTNKLWDMDAMPLSLRFVIVNDTGDNWSNLRVTLECPDGWKAQGRRPLHWDPADNLESGKVALQLEDLPASTKTVAPFWVKNPDTVKISMVWWDTSVGPFHHTSQPGEGIRLFTIDPYGEVDVCFKAELHAKTAGGKTIRKLIEVPVEIKKRLSS